MTPNAKTLNDILETIAAAPSDTRYIHYTALSDAIHALQDDGEPVPPAARDLAEDLLGEAVEARFDNMPV